MPKVLSTSVNADGGPHFDILAQAGFDVEAVDRSVDLFDEDTLISQMQGASAVSAGSEPYTARVIESLPDLRVISRSGVGFDAVDLAACDEKGVVVTVTPGVNHHAVAEHTIALLMGVARGFPERHDRVKGGRWFREPYPRVMGSTIGILGLGRIGKAIARRAEAFDMTIAYHGRSEQPEVAYRFEPSLVELARNSDFLIASCVGGESTRNLINKEVLEALGASGILVNVARGSVVDEPALISALQSGTLLAAGLDVFANEPHVPEELIQMPNIVLQPHQASATKQTRLAMGQLMVDNLDAHFSGKPPLTPVNSITK